MLPAGGRQHFTCVTCEFVYSTHVIFLDFVGCLWFCTGLYCVCAFDYSIYVGMFEEIGEFSNLWAMICKCCPFLFSSLSCFWWIFCCICVFRFVMRKWVAACTAFWQCFPEINKLCKVASRWEYIKRNVLTMHGPTNVKFIDAKRTKETYQYKNIKRKLYKSNAAIWYNKVCRQKQLTPNYISIRINGKNQQCQKTVQAATHFRINQEIKFLYIKKQKLNEQLYNLHIKCATIWQNYWHIIQLTIDRKLQQ